MDENRLSGRSAYGAKRPRCCAVQGAPPMPRCIGWIKNSSTPEACSSRPRKLPDRLLLPMNRLQKPMTVFPHRGSLISLGALSLLTVIMTACSPLSGPGPSPVLQHAATAPVSLPDYAVGRWFAYDDGSRDTVAEVEGETVIWEDEKGRFETRYRNPALPRLKWSKGRTKVQTEADALWPLVPANSVRFNEVRDLFDENGAVETRKKRTWSCEVKDLIFLVTDAVSMDTYPIICKRLSNGRSGKLLETKIFHYAPEINHYIRYERIDRQGNRRSKNLIDYGETTSS